MFRSVFSKTLYDKRWFTFGWVLGAIGLFAFTTAFFPSLRDSGVDQIMKAIPPAMKNMVGNMAEMNTFAGYVGSAVFGLRAQMLFIPLAIILGVSLGVSEESKGKLYQLLAQPVSRVHIAWQKFAAGVVIITTIISLGVASVWAVAPMIHEAIPTTLLVKIGLLSILFTTALFSVTYSLGVAFGRKTLALTLPVFWVLFSIVCDAFSGQIEWMKYPDYASILHYFHTFDLVRQALNLRHVAVLGAVAVIPFFLSLILFKQRNLREEAS